MVLRGDILTMKPWSRETGRAKLEDNTSATPCIKEKVQLGIEDPKTSLVVRLQKIVKSKRQSHLWEIIRLVLM